MFETTTQLVFWASWFMFWTVTVQENIVSQNRSEPPNALKKLYGWITYMKGQKMVLHNYTITVGKWRYGKHSRIPNQHVSSKQKPRVAVPWETRMTSEQWKKNGRYGSLGYIGDEKLPSYVRIILKPL